MGFAGSSASGLNRLKSRCWLGAIILSSSKLPQVLGRIQFLVVVGLRFLFSYWLLIKVNSQFLEATLQP